MSNRCVVVTGMGALTPLGLNLKQTWKAILEGKSGIGPVTDFDASQFRSQICGPVKEGFDITQYISRKEARQFDEFIHYAIAAADEAIKNSGLVVNEFESSRIGVAVGSGIGGLTSIERNHVSLLEQGPKRISPFFISSSIINDAAGYISIRHGLKGPNIAVVSACTTGAHNIGIAARMIRCGDADVMIAGGSEKGSCPLGIGGFSAARALSTRNDDPTRASRPWDRDRDGFVLSDGAGILILEDYEHAKARGATIYAEMAGFGMSADAYRMTAPDASGAGAMASMEGALRDAGCPADEVDYLNAHGTSTPIGDAVEALAVSKTFKNSLDTLAVSSTKSMTGHMLGAAGAVEALFSVLAIRDQVAPPTINLDNPIEDYPINFVPHTAQPRPIRIALSNSIGFGGTNGSLLFKHPDLIH